MNFYDSLPMVNAVLNGTAAILLIIGFLLIKNRKIRMHRNVMLTAFAVSCVFLVCYLLNHYHAGIVYYKGSMRTLYLSILWTHTPLAAAVPVLAIITLSRGLNGRIARHKAIARWTLPIWLYVSITGVVVYLMLYR
jgi:putative membrane protein